MVRADWAIVTGWQKMLLGVALCLPIPALSVSGLELPLPSAVYRVAAALVESTEGLAGAFTGGHEQASVRSDRTTTVLTRAQPAEPSRRIPQSVARAEPARTPRRVERVVPTRARNVGSTPVKSSRVSPRAAGAPARAPSAPAPDTNPGTIAAAPTPAPSALEPGRERASTEPVQRPAETSPIEAPAVKPPVSTSPPPPPPPPAVTPTLLDPVMKPLEPVTKPLEPVTDVLTPVTEPLAPVTGRLGIP